MILLADSNPSLRTANVFQRRAAEAPRINSSRWSHQQHQAQTRRFGGCGSVRRNEANWRRKWLSGHGGWRFRNRCVGGLLGEWRGMLDELGWLLDGRGRGRGLEVLEGFEGAEVHAVGALDAALNACEGIEGGVEGVAEGGIVLDGGVEEIGVGEIVEAFDAIVPELGFDAAEAALDPLGGDEGVDERELVGIGGAEVEEEGSSKGFEFGGVFAGDDVGPGVDAGFEGVERGGGFALGRGGAGGFLGVEAVGVDLGLGGHG
jgi:hypothetical protein